MSTRNEFVKCTIGAEVRKVCEEYVGTANVADRFVAFDHSKTSWVEIRWWKGRELKKFSRYEVMAPDRASNRPPDYSDYVPEEETPPSPGYDLQVAVYQVPRSPEDEKLIAIHPAPDDEKVLRAMIDRSLDVVVFE